MIKIDKITLNNFKFFIDEIEHNTFELNGKNMLLYGENGSGKSSLFKAFEFLTKVKNPNISNELIDNKNIFAIDKEVSLEYKFSNNQEIRISDKESLDIDLDFINNFGLINPLLDYKKFLYLNFTTDFHYKKINIYPILKKLFKNYPLEDNTLFKDLKNPNLELDTLQEIIDTIFDDINMFLKRFTDEFSIKKFIYTMDYIPLAKSLGLENALEFVINLEIDFQKNIIKEHHNFLNEAKLTMLALSIYFAIIKHLSKNSKGAKLNILVLDDVLISLDMNNRLNLIDVLKSEFSDFQIIFFTHDKNFFNILKEKMKWKSYEIYVNSRDLEKPYIKKSLNYFESAKKYFDEYDYPLVLTICEKR